MDPIDEIKEFGEALEAETEYVEEETPSDIFLTSDVKFMGHKGYAFVIKASDAITPGSDESRIYGCYRVDSDEKLAARIVVSVTPDSPEEEIEVRERVITFLERVSGSPDSHILPLLEHGTAKINGRPYFVEVYPYCEEADLGKRKGSFTLRQLSKEVIPALNSALRYIHSSGLVYRDLKPENLLMFNGRVVLADFGMACPTDENGYAIDRERMGTLGYYAPELMSQPAVKASDYYSMGQTLWTLYSGEMMYADVIRKTEELGPEEQKQSVGLAMVGNSYFGLEEIPEEDAFFAVLLRGLLQFDPALRFDNDAVNRWMEGDKSVITDVSEAEKVRSYTRAFSLFGAECWDDADVCAQLCENWDEGIEALYDGTVKDFYLTQDLEKATFIEKTVSELPAGEDEQAEEYFKSVGLAKFILYLSENRILCWKGEMFESPAELGLYIEDYLYGKGKENDIYGLIFSELVTEWYRKSQNAFGGVVDELVSITEMLKTGEFGAKTAIYMLYFLFVQDRRKVKMDECRELKEYVRYMLEHPGRIYCNENNRPIIDSPRFMALLCAWGYEEAVKLFVADSGEEYAERFETFFDFLAGMAESEEDMNRVALLYCECGPRGHLTWWRKNMDHYVYCGKKARALKKKMEAVDIDPYADLDEQRKVFATLNNLSKQFLELFESDIFMGSMGIEGFSEDYVYSDRLSDGWFFEFLGQKAPLGFKYHLEILEPDVPEVIEASEKVEKKLRTATGKLREEYVEFAENNVFYKEDTGGHIVAPLITYVILFVLVILRTRVLEFLRDSIGKLPFVNEGTAEKIRNVCDNLISVNEEIWFSVIVFGVSAAILYKFYKTLMKIYCRRIESYDSGIDALEDRIAENLAAYKHSGLKERIVNCARYNEEYRTDTDNAPGRVIAGIRKKFQRTNEVAKVSKKWVNLGMSLAVFTGMLFFIKTYVGERMETGVGGGMSVALVFLAATAIINMIVFGSGVYLGKLSKIAGVLMTLLYGGAITEAMRHYGLDRALDLRTSGVFDTVNRAYILIPVLQTLAILATVLLSDYRSEREKWEKGFEIDPSFDFRPEGNKKTLFIRGSVSGALTMIICLFMSGTEVTRTTISLFGRTWKSNNTTFMGGVLIPIVILGILWYAANCLMKPRGSHLYAFWGRGRAIANEFMMFVMVISAMVFSGTAISPYEMVFMLFCFSVSCFAALIAHLINMAV